MYTIDNTYKYSLEEKKSTFLAYLTPFENFEELLQELKEQHPKARHFVRASRTLNEFEQIVESFSDDGEPKGTSGVPTLKVLQGFDLIEVGVIVVRYFGGTLLGTGGLARAYSDVVNFAVEDANLFQYTKKSKKSLHVKYSDLGKFEHRAKKFGIDIEKEEFIEDGVFISCEASKERLEKFLDSSVLLYNLIS